MHAEFITDQTAYSVEKAAWISTPGNHLPKNESKRLTITVTVKNLKDHAVPVPPLHVIGDDGVLIGGESPQQVLPPGAKKKLTFYFDVPETQKYRLQVEGDRFTGEPVNVRLQTPSEAVQIFESELPKLLLQLCQRSVVCGNDKEGRDKRGLPLCPACQGRTPQFCMTMEKSLSILSSESLWAELKEEVQIDKSHVVGFDSARWASCLSQADRIACADFEEKADAFLYNRANDCNGALIVDSKRRKDRPATR